MPNIGPLVSRREFLLSSSALLAGQPQFRLVDATQSAGIDFLHNSGAFGEKYLPETLGAGCAFLDYDNDGWQDILLVNGMDWPGHKRSRSTLRLYRNNRNGTFTDVTRAAGLDVEMYGMGVAVGDYNNDGFPDLFISCVGQSRLFENTGRGTFVDVAARNGTFEEIAVRAGLAFSEDGKARAGMGVDAGDYDNSGIASLVVTNFENEMMGLYHSAGGGLYTDQAAHSDVGKLTRRSLGFGCFFFDANLDGLLDLLLLNGHIDDSLARLRKDVQYAQPPHLFLNTGGGGFHDVAAELGAGFTQPKVARGAAFGDFDNDGDLDVLITSNNGPAYLYRNDRIAGNHSIRFRLIGTQSNRDGIGALVRIYYGGQSSSRMVRTGSSYLSQSELPVTFGLGKRDSIDRAVIRWPNGRVEEFKNLKAGRYDCVEAKGIQISRT